MELLPFHDPSAHFYHLEELVFDGTLDGKAKHRSSLSEGRRWCPRPPVRSIHDTHLRSQRRGIGGQTAGHLPPIPPVRRGEPAPGDKARGMLLTDTKHKARFVMTNARGQIVKKKKKKKATLKVQLFKVNWRWWWEKVQTISRNTSKATASKPFNPQRSSKERPRQL